MPELKAIIADADGTLVNTLHLIRRGQYEAARSYLERHGVPAADIPAYEVYEPFLNQSVGGTTRETLEKTLRLVYAAKPQHIGAIDYGEILASLKNIQDEIAPKYVKPYPGLSDLLGWVGESGLGFGVFTSGSPHHVIRNFGLSLPQLECTELYLQTGPTDAEKILILEARLRDVFNIPEVAIVAEGDAKASKPHPESLNLAMRRLQVDSEATAALGDHSVDMLAAISAQIPVRIGVTHGFDDADTLTQAGATAIINSLTELPALLTP